MLFVKDIRRMADFYGETLGLKPIEPTRTETWVEFDAGQTRFALHSIPAHIAGQIRISSPAQPREWNPVKLIFAVTNLEQERARLAASGINLTVNSMGACDGVDPEGNIFQICAGNGQ
jgi:catechol 2,3-dioxygenase-like lactoylglutathione lyase family enzyme